MQARDGALIDIAGPATGEVVERVASAGHSEKERARAAADLAGREWRAARRREESRYGIDEYRRLEHPCDQG